MTDIQKLTLACEADPLPYHVLADQFEEIGQPDKALKIRLDAMMMEIISDPDNDAPRLAYADLIEDGDPVSARHIRRSVDRVIASPETGHLSSLNQFIPWTMAGWKIANLAYIPGYKTALLRRGFIEHLHCTFRQWEGISESAFWSPVMNQPCRTCRGGKAFPGCVPCRDTRIEARPRPFARRRVCLNARKICPAPLFSCYEHGFECDCMGPAEYSCYSDCNNCFGSGTEVLFGRSSVQPIRLVDLVDENFSIRHQYRDRFLVCFGGSVDHIRDDARTHVGVGAANNGFTLDRWPGVTFRLSVYSLR